MAGKKTGAKGEKQVHRIPSANCPECSGDDLVPMQRILLVGLEGGKRWACKAHGHILPRGAAVVKLDPPQAPITKASPSGSQKKKR